MSLLFGTAFVLGLLFNVSPGAVFAETMRRGMRGGFYPALYVQIGSLVGDACWAILGLAGAGLLFQIPSIRVPLTLAGALYFAYLGYGCLVDALRPAEQAHEPAGRLKTSQSAVMAGVTISVTNPKNVIYWAALGGVLGGLGFQNPGTLEYSVFFAGFMASSFFWCFVCAWLIDFLSRNLTGIWRQSVDIVLAMTLFFLSFVVLREIF
ncbi:LysE family translocator [Allorhizobium sp. BGMRC 0089]|uniref:LysE family transporter n=1 Tax=Allorhizobium sonneratiae TaxID=2934936 RepID=UPI0020332C4D|nr:LysE family transporter [Allorhizobium sonneratiae]MCM2292966.1 LysE family translocator [Allorhizobium sonneratiae]